MGCWGMGMAQTDEFCEIYDKFMEEYDNGKPVSEITAAVLAEYHAEDGIMHDVYFALAKAEWMCCEQSELVLNRVKEIIESGANIEFYRELEATESDLKVRGRNLEKFLKMISVSEGLYLTSLMPLELPFGYKKDFKAMFGNSNCHTLSEVFATDS